VTGCPGVDVDFENVGGETMDAVFARLKLRARVVLCGPDLGLQRARAAARPAQLPEAVDEDGLRELCEGLSEA
jgi:NADPH-dependent curcumin reductase CurA